MPAREQAPVQHAHGLVYCGVLEEEGAGSRTHNACQARPPLEHSTAQHSTAQHAQRRVATARSHAHPHELGGRIDIHPQAKPCQLLPRLPVCPWSCCRCTWTHRVPIPAPAAAHATRAAARGPAAHCAATGAVAVAGSGAGGRQVGAFGGQQSTVPLKHSLNVLSTVVSHDRVYGFGVDRVM